MNEAIRLALGAATKLEARDPTTVRHFVRVFGHDPSWPVPWAGNTASGVTVAYRLRKVAEELQGRVVHFRCTCPGAAANVVAQTDWDADHNAIELCPMFWNPPAGLPMPAVTFRAETIIHEMLHLLFHEFFHHAGHPSGDPERHRDNSNCYEAFAVLANGQTPDPAAVAACAARPF